MADIEKFKRYIGQSSALELEAEDGTKETFEIKPLPFKYISELVLIGKAFAKIPEDAPPEDFLQCLDEQTLARMKNIVEAVLEISYPDLPQDIRDAFATRNFIPLITKIFEINSLGGKAEVVQKKLRELRKKK